MRLRLLAAGTAVTAVTAGSALAQQMPVITPKRTFDLGARVEALYDSNIARGSAALAALRGIEREDELLRPAVTANIVQPFGSQLLFVTGSAGYDFHRRNSELDRGRVDAVGGVAGTFGPCQPMLATSYKAAQSEFSDEDDITTRNLQKATAILGGVTCGRAIGPGIMVNAEREDVKNSATLRETSDHTDERFTTQLGYKNPTLGEAALLYSYANVEFPNRIIPGRPVGDGFWTAAYGVTYKRRFGSRIMLDGTAARTRVKREFAPAGAPLKFNSTTYGANIDYRLGSRLELQGHALREVKPSNRPGKVFDLATSGEVLAKYKLGTRYMVTLGHRIEDIDSNRDTSFVGRPTVTNSRTNSSYAGVQYRRSDKLSLSLDVRREERKTNLPDFNYTSMRVGLSASAGF
jgi:hypothetical protein